jgi:hypothetical protein
VRASIGPWSKQATTLAESYALRFLNHSTENWKPMNTYLSKRQNLQPSKGLCQFTNRRRERGRGRFVRRCANLSKASAGRVYFVPEGQHDSSQARSAWDYEENSPVPARRLNRSWLRNHHDIQNQVEHPRRRTFPQEYQAFLKRHEHSTHSTRCRLLRAGALSLAHARAAFRRQIISGTDNAFDRPSGTGPLCISTQALRAWLRSRSPSGTKPFAQRSTSH